MFWQQCVCRYKLFSTSEIHGVSSERILITASGFTSTYWKCVAISVRIYIYIAALSQVSKKLSFLPVRSIPASCTGQACIINTLEFEVLVAIEDQNCRRLHLVGTSAEVSSTSFKSLTDTHSLWTWIKLLSYRIQWTLLESQDNGFWLTSWDVVN